VHIMRISIAIGLVCGSESGAAYRPVRGWPTQRLMVVMYMAVG
jgi:hypothetical protein